MPPTSEAERQRLAAWRAWLSVYYCAAEAWWQAAEYATMLYPHELALYQAENPRPTLKEHMIATARRTAPAPVEAGQIYQDLDPRHPGRFVRVRKVFPDEGFARIRNMRTGRESFVRLARLQSGYRNGFALVRNVVQ